MTWKRYALLGGVLSVFLAGRYCGRGVENNPRHAGLLPSRPNLMPDDKEIVAVDFDANRVSVITPTGVKQTTGARKAVITVKHDGTVQVVARPYGLTFEPGLGAAYGDGPGLILDLQVAYWRDLGALAGIRIFPKPTFYLAAGYCLSAIRMRNTSVFLGVALGREILGGVRVAF